jgi:FkbM family methyltransferase
MRFDNVTVVPMAVSNTCGQMPLHIPAGLGETHAASLEAASTEQGARGGTLHGLPPAGSMPHPPNTILVETITLDAFFARQDHCPNFLKIDVEGHESAVLEGARQTLATHRPVLLVECESRHRTDGDVRPVFQLLQSYGYEGSFFYQCQRHPLADFEAAKHQKLRPDAAKVPRGYVNNFAFVPRGM